MKSSSALFLLAAAVLALGGCHRAEAPRGPEPLAVGKVVVPAAGQSQAQVVALNGQPERREAVEGGEVWIYSRLMADGLVLRSRTAQVRFRDGIVIEVGESTSAWTPNPTFPEWPVAQASTDESRR
ncbi:MAG TPA: hypothetical protein VLK84_13330 [Longimicrobium sp.]|nr:hypothetical protein [Longimicrobium sp.]